MAHRLQRPADTAVSGWTIPSGRGAFARMEQFIRDTGLTAADLELNYDDVTGMFGKGAACHVL